MKITPTSTIIIDNGDHYTITGYSVDVSTLDIDLDKPLYIEGDVQSDYYITSNSPLVAWSITSPTISVVGWIFAGRITGRVETDNVYCDGAMLAR